MKIAAGIFKHLKVENLFILNKWFLSYVVPETLFSTLVLSLSHIALVGMLQVIVGFPHFPQ